MAAPWPRAAFGFFAGALSVLIFHQGMWAFLHGLKEMPAPYPMRPVPPFGLPFVIDLAFWGGVWGVLFGLALPKLPRGTPMWLRGLGLGILAALVGMFVVEPLKGAPVADGFALMGLARSFLINGFWGIGVGLMLPLMLPNIV